MERPAVVERAAGTPGLRRMLVRGAAVALAALAVVAIALAARADAFVYWTESGLQSIGWANLDGSEANDTVLFTDRPQGVAVDSAHLYWVSAGAIGRADLTGLHADESFIDGVSGAKGLAVDGAHIYWTSSGTNGNWIGRANLDGTGVDQTFIGTAVPAAGVAVDSAHVYWTNSATNAIGRANLDGTAPDQTFITGGANPQGVAVDSAHVYWANGDSGTIGRANIGGSGADQSFIAAGNPLGVAVDSAHIWWANGATFSAIGQANLDGTSVNQRFIPTATSPTAVAVDALTLGGPGPGSGPPRITRLVANIKQGGLPRGTERSLLAKLGVVERKLDAGNRQGACGSLGAFGNELDALSGKRLDGALAAELVAEATAIRQLVGCDAGP